MLKVILKPEIQTKEESNLPPVNKTTQEFLPFTKGELTTIVAKNELQAGIPQGGLISPLLMN